MGPERQKRLGGAHGAGVIGGCKQLMWMLETNSDPLREHQWLLAA